MEIAMPVRFTFLGLFFVCLIVALLTTTAAASKSTGHFIQDATIGNQFEISSSRIALQNSRNDDVKQFAQQMVDDHTQIGNNLKSVISNSNVALTEPTNSLDAKHRALLTKLRKASGTDFDQKYMNAQLDAHEDAVALFKDYAKDGDNDALRSFASQTLPTLEEHQQHIKQLRASYF
jgi:putative membrane protein